MTARPFVVFSELSAPDGGAEALEQAFQGRLGAVDAHPGFIDLQVWRDTRAAGRFVMVSWWQSRADYLAYMRSADHRRSHDRIPTGALAPRAVAVRKYELIAR